MQTNYHHDILRIALPSILSNITVPLLGLIDLFIAGHLGSVIYIGAIAIGSTIFSMIYWIFGFLRMGTTGMTSQAFGKNNDTECIELLGRSLLISGSIAILLILLQLPISAISIYFMQPSTEVRMYASLYFNICIWGAPAVLSLYSLSGWFIGMQNAKYPLWIALIQNIINIICSLVLVFIFHLGVIGVAIGTIIAQYTGLLAALYFAGKQISNMNAIHIPTLVQLLNKKDISRFFSVNRDIFLRTLCLVTVTTYFTSSGSKQNEIILAVNALLMQFFTLYSYFMDGFANAGEALSGRFSGAQNKKALTITIKNIFQWGLGLATVFTLIYAIGGEWFINILTSNTLVKITSKEYIYWIMAIPFSGIIAFVWDGIFIGLTATRLMLISMIAASIVFFAIHYFAEPIWKNHALWLSFIIYLGVRGIVQTLLYRITIRKELRSKP